MVEGASHLRFIVTDVYKGRRVYNCPFYFRARSHGYNDIFVSINSTIGENKSSISLYSLRRRKCTYCVHFALSTGFRHVI